MCRWGTAVWVVHATSDVPRRPTGREGVLSTEQRVPGMPGQPGIDFDWDIGRRHHGFHRGLVVAKEKNQHFHHDDWV